MSDKDPYGVGHTNALMAQHIREGLWLAPLELLMLWANDKLIDMNLRVNCAKIAADYMHSKMPAQVDLKVERRPFEEIPTEELVTALRLIK